MIEKGTKSRDKRRSDLRWTPSSLQLFSDPTLEKSHPLLYNLNGLDSGHIKFPKLVSNITPYYESPPCKNLMREKLKLLQRLWGECGVPEEEQNDFVSRYFFSRHPHETYKNISEEVMKVFSIKWLDVRLRGLIEQREYIMRRMGEMIDESIRIHFSMSRKRMKSKSRDSTSMSVRKNMKKFRNLNSSRILKRRSRKEKYTTTKTSGDGEDTKQQLQEGPRKTTSSSSKHLHSRGGDSHTKSTTSLLSSVNHPSRQRDFDTSMLLKILPVSSLKEIVDKVSEQVQIYRTVSLYVVEYIGTIMKKLKTESYYWNEEDYLLRMANDFAELVISCPSLGEVLEILQVRPSRLCFPLNPSLYYESFDCEDFNMFEKKKKKLENVQTFQDKDVERENIKALEINPHYDESEDIHNKVTDGDDDRGNGSSTFLTELKSFNRKKRKKKKKRSTSGTTDSKKDVTNKHADEDGSSNCRNKKRKKKLTMKTLHQYINLKPLLSVQKFRDRRKRHKKYSEPLFSVRHEDLCREANINPFDFHIQEAFLLGKPIFRKRRRRRKNRNRRRRRRRGRGKSDDGSNDGEKRRGSGVGGGGGGITGRKRGGGGGRAVVGFARKGKSKARRNVYLPANLWNEVLRVQAVEERIEKHYMKHRKNESRRNRRKRLSRGAYYRNKVSARNGARRKLIFNRQTE